MFDRGFVPILNSTSNVFSFSDFELTPTLDEFGGFTKLGKDNRMKTLIAIGALVETNF